MKESGAESFKPSDKEKDISKDIVQEKHGVSQEEIEKETQKFYRINHLVDLVNAKILEEKLGVSKPSKELTEEEKIAQEVFEKREEIQNQIETFYENLGPQYIDLDKMSKESQEVLKKFLGISDKDKPEETISAAKPSLNKPENFCRIKQFRTNLPYLKWENWQANIEGKGAFKGTRLNLSEENNRKVNLPRNKSIKIDMNRVEVLKKERFQENRKKYGLNIIQDLEKDLNPLSTLPIAYLIKEKEISYPSRPFIISERETKHAPQLEFIGRAEERWIKSSIGDACHWDIVNAERYRLLRPGGEIVKFESPSLSKALGGLEEIRCYDEERDPHSYNFYFDIFLKNGLIKFGGQVDNGKLSGQDSENQKFINQLNSRQKEIIRSISLYTYDMLTHPERIVGTGIPRSPRVIPRGYEEFKHLPSKEYPSRATEGMPRNSDNNRYIIIISEKRGLERNHRAYFRGGHEILWQFFQELPADQQQNLLSREERILFQSRLVLVDNEAEIAECRAEREKHKPETQICKGLTNRIEHLELGRLRNRQEMFNSLRNQSEYRDYSDEDLYKIEKAATKKLHDAFNERVIDIMRRAKNWDEQALEELENRGLSHYVVIKRK